MKGYDGMRKKTNDEFIAEVAEMYGDEYTVLSEYQGNKEKVLIRHNNESCGFFENEVSPNHFLRGRRCRKCSQKSKADKLRKTHDQFVDEVFRKYGDEYTVLGKYINAMQAVLIRHNNDSCERYEWSPKPNDFLKSSKGCPKCFGNILKTTKSFKEEIYGLVGDEYSVLGEYVGNHSPIEMRHNSDKCINHTWKIEPNSFTSGGRRCPVCANDARRISQLKKHETFIKEVYDLVGDEFTVVGEYSGNKKGVLIRHNNESCRNHEWSPYPNGFLRGNRCPKCSQSRGEKSILRYLESIGVCYRAQYRIKDCRYKLPLPFDFAIFNEKDDLVLLIEYDGELHFKKSAYPNADQKLASIQKTDKIKNDYCEANEIQLLRIKYTSFNDIENILENKLAELNIGGIIS